MIRLLKLMLISFLVLFGMITLISLLIPSSIRISRAINVGARSNVAQMIRDTTRWPQWHPAFNDSSGVTRISITPQKMDSLQWIFNLSQGERPPVRNGFQLHTYPQGDSSTLQWYMDFKLPWYPWHKFGSLFYESTYGAMMEKGLSSIREKASN